jgi:hypothetical protein
MCMVSCTAAVQLSSPAPVLHPCTYRVQSPRADKLLYMLALLRLGLVSAVLPEYRYTTQAASVAVLLQACALVLCACCIRHSVAHRRSAASVPCLWCPSWGHHGVVSVHGFGMITYYMQCMLERVLARMLTCVSKRSGVWPEAFFAHAPQVRKKVLVFVNDVNEGVRPRLFLEAFGIRPALLNAELPLNSRRCVRMCMRVCAEPTGVGAAGWGGAGRGARGMCARGGRPVPGHRQARKGTRALRSHLI